MSSREANVVLEVKCIEEKTAHHARIPREWVEVCLALFRAQHRLCAIVVRVDGQVIRETKC